MRYAAFVVLAALAPLLARADNPAEVMEMGRIDVVGTTPLPSLGTPLSDVPANVQTFGGRDLDRQRPPSVPSFLERNAAAVAINAAQGNPFQPDISYRGFTASPLLGTPQGIAVFQDGVRVNEPFGDIVNWDLIPPNAIEAIQLVPGVSAAFGPNTLGAALAVYTKSGDENPGGMLDLLGGSWARKAARASLACQPRGASERYRRKSRAAAAGSPACASAWAWMMNASARFGSSATARWAHSPASVRRCRACADWANPRTTVASSGRALTATAQGSAA